MNYTQHEISAFWPAMSAPEFRALVADIAANGQHNEIWLYEGQVLDGWHRARACAELGIEPKTREYTDGSPNKFANSQNGPRRHLPESVRAICATKAAQWRPHGDQGTILKIQDRGQTSAQIAESVQVSVSHIESAKAVIASGLDGEVMAGKIGLRPAAELARKAPEVAARVVAGITSPAQGKAELQAKVKRELPTVPAPDLNVELDRLCTQLDDMRAELMELRAASYDEQLRNQARDEIAGLREALALEQRLHDALKAQRETVEYQLTDWKRRCASLEKQLARRERGE